jgi:hypothetical protein
VILSMMFKYTQRTLSNTDELEDFYRLSPTRDNSYWPIAWAVVNKICVCLQIIE